MWELYNYLAWLLTHRLRLRHIVFLGLLCRLYFSYFSDHVYYPDEIFQTLEQAYRLITGYGVLPWEYAYHLRSYVPAFLLAVPLRVLLSITRDSEWYGLAMRIILSSASLILIPAAHAISFAAYRSRKLALVTAFGVAIWYELIYFSPRALTELFATHFFAASALLHLDTRWSKKHVLLGMLVGMGFMIRIMYLPLGLYILYLMLKRVGQIGANRRVLGVILAIMLFGMVDFIMYDAILVHVPMYLKLSVINGLSTIFGTLPWWYYPSALFVTSGGLVLSFLNKRILSHARWIWIAILMVLIPHSMIPHKEYRFIVVAIPLLLILGIRWLHLMLTARSRRPYLYTALLLTALSVAGVQQYLPVTSIYPYRFWESHTYDTIRKAAQTASCGVWNTRDSWVDTSSNYLAGTTLPLYSVDAPPIPGTYDVVMSNEGDDYVVVSKVTSCVRQPPVYLRSFEEVEQMLF